MANSVEIRACKCSHGFQDERYGRGNRVYNRGLKSWTCTVCGASIAAEPIKKVTSSAKDGK